MNLLEIAALVIVVLFTVSGLRRGFVRKLASILSLAGSILLVSLLLPYITQFLKEQTPVYSYIVEQCQNVVVSRIGQSAAQAEGIFKEARLDVRRMSLNEEGTDRVTKAGPDTRGAVIEKLAQNGSSYPDGAAAQDALRQLGENGGQAVQELFNMIAQSEEVQRQIIQELPIPKFLREQLIKYNNSEGYRSLGVSTFLDYVINYIASAILNVLAFALAVMVVQVVLWFAVRILDKLTRVPGINLMNRLAGGALGMLQGLFILCLLLLLISVFETTPQGQAALQMVRESAPLDFIYETNIFLHIVLRAAAVFV